MNTTQTSISAPPPSRQALRLGAIRNVPILLHNSFWPGLLLWLAGPGLLALGTVALALIFQAVAHTMLLCRLGGNTSGWVIFAFGPRAFCRRTDGTTEDTYYSLPSRRRPLALMAGPLMNLFLGCCLVLARAPLLGQAFLLCGLLALLPAWPLNGAMLAREYLRAQGAPGGAAEVRLLELSRACLALLGLPCLLTLNLAGLYVVAVLWFIAHFELLGLDFPQTCGATRQWFRHWGRLLFQWLRSGGKGIFVATILLLAISNGQALPVFSDAPVLTQDVRWSQPQNVIHPEGMFMAIAICGWLLGLFFAVMLAALEREVKALEVRLHRLEAAFHQPPVGHLPGPSVEPVAPPAASPGKVVMAPAPPPHPFADVTILPPVRLLDEVSQPASRKRWWSGLRQTPVAQPPGPWRLAFATHCGHVRSHNEDYCLAFETEGFQVGIVADGVGGEKYGEFASYLAVRAAAHAIVGALRGAWLGRKPTPLMLVALAATAASSELQSQARNRGIVEDFRTTCIILVGNQKEWELAHIGDGGGLLLGSLGRLERLVEPHKADLSAPNIITSSLGPTPAGTWRHCRQPRRPGDICLLGSDGLFDKGLPCHWPQDFVAAAVAAGGNLQPVAEHFLGELAEHRDECGYVFDDNLSLVILGSDEPPTVPSPASDPAALLPDPGPLASTNHQAAGSPKSDPESL